MSALCHVDSTEDRTRVKSLHYICKKHSTATVTLSCTDSTASMLCTDQRSQQVCDCWRLQLRPREDCALISYRTHLARWTKNQPSANQQIEDRLDFTTQQNGKVITY